MANANEEWELSKENIQPIQQGRKQKILKVALAPHPEDLILQQRQAFENELRMYSGDDPLSVWCKYIKWVEQNFPKGGKDGHIKQLIEQCLSILKDSKMYYDDDRFIDILLKFANMNTKPIEVYNYMYSHNIGCKSAKFFINWSWELEQLGNFKKADEVLTEGLQRKAEPFELIQSHRKEFEVRFMKKIKEGSEVHNSEAEYGRSAFSILKPQKKNLAPVSRIGEAVFENKKPLLLGRQQPQPKSITSSAKLPFKIYNSENIMPSLPVQDQSHAPFILQSENYKENEKKPSKWNKAKIRSHTLKTSSEVNQINFQFHCDDENELQICTPRCVPKTSNILTVRRETSSPPMALFECPDPLKKPMYPKNKVYGGAVEFSLEEIRAAEWYEKKKKHEQELLLAEQQKIIEEKSKKELLLQKEIENLTKQVELLQNYQNSVNKPCEFSGPLENGNHTAKMVQDFYNETLSHTVDETECKETLEVNFEFDKKCIGTLSSINLPDLLDKSSHGKKSISLNELKNNSSIPPFTFYQDPSEVFQNSKEISSQNIANEQCILQTNPPEKENYSKEYNTNLPFVFYQDPTEVLKDSNEFSSQNTTNKENLACNKSSTSLSNEDSEEDIENIPPKGYIQEENKRELAGVLEPSKNILFIPLEEQEKSEDDSDVDDAYICQRERQHANETLIPPSNTEQFSAATFFASTPYVSRNNYKNNEIINSQQQTALLHAGNEMPDICPIKENKNSVTKESANAQCIVNKVEVKDTRVSGFYPGLPNVLSTIMETSSETYGKSSSSSGSSVNLTKSNHLDSLPTYSVDFDPFDSEFTENLLKSVNINSYKNLYHVNKSIKSVKLGENISIGTTYRILSLVAEGAYARVYEAETTELCGNYCNEKVALKVCKRANEWEFYICSEMQKRLAEKEYLPDVKKSLMTVTSAIKYSDGIILVNEYSNLGTLLDFVNFYKKQNTAIPELVVLYITLEILEIVSKLHEINIIHGDIKPDNFLISNKAFDYVLDKLSESTTFLQLIDFGRAIDLNLLAKGICFTKTLDTSYFKCTEMKENKPWVFQLDWYGVLSCIHTMLFSEYMAVKKVDGKWKIEKKFKRYWYNVLWEPLFTDLLNIPECYKEPDVRLYINMIKSKLEQNSSNLLSQMARFAKLFPEKK